MILIFEKRTIHDGLLYLKFPTDTDTKNKYQYKRLIPETGALVVVYRISNTQPIN